MLFRGKFLGAFIWMHFAHMCLLTHPGGLSFMRLWKIHQRVGLGHRGLGHMWIPEIINRTHTKTRLSLWHFALHLIKQWSTQWLGFTSSWGFPPRNNSLQTLGLAFLFIASLECKHKGPPASKHMLMEETACTAVKPTQVSVTEHAGKWACLNLCVCRFLLQPWFKLDKLCKMGEGDQERWLMWARGVCSWSVWLQSCHWLGLGEQ